MKLCFCRFILAAAVVVLAVMSLFYQTCCCRSMGKTEEGAGKA